MTLPSATQAWVEEIVGGRVVAVRRLTGGITSAIDRLSITTAQGSSTTVVLRRWVGRDPCEVEDREPRVLRLLETTSVPAPRLLGVSDGSQTDGVAAILMRRVPGRIELAPTDPRGSLAQMARTLVEIQNLVYDFPVYEPSPRPKPAEIPGWVERPKVWRAALADLQHPPPRQPWGFTHGDFQPFNLLWSRQKLTGVVDWAYPCVTSPDLDVGHCRLNLTLLYGYDRAEAFRHAYEAEAGRRTHPWWDLHRFTGYSPAWQEIIPRQVAGRAVVDVAGMTRRVEEAIAQTLKRQ